MALKKEHEKYLIELFTSNAYKQRVISLLKTRLYSIKEYLNTYHHTDDLYFCDEEFKEKATLEEIIKELED